MGWIKPPERPMGQVLVVDDNADTLLIATRALERMGAEVVACASVDEAVEFLHWNVPDLVITDLIFPTISGYSLLEHLRGSPRLRNVPVLAMSGRKNEVMIERARELGAVQFLAKPVTPEKLRELVAGLLA